METEIKEATTGFDRIDTENRMLKGVVLLGADTKNKYLMGTIGTKFTENARRSLASLGEGVKVFLDHASEREDKDNRGVRSIRDLAGYLESTHVDTDGKVKGNLHYLRAHAELIEDLAANMAPAIGLSIHGFGDVHREGDYGIVESFSRLPSVDFVSAPASCSGGLFESRQQSGELREGLNSYDRALIADSDLQGRDHDALREMIATKNATRAANKKSRTLQDDYLEILNAPDDDHF